TRRGRAVAVIVATDEFERLERLRAAGPQAGLAGLVGGWEGSEDLVSELDARRRTPPRPAPEVD
ncbi:MAG: hypothetical protein ABR510_12460, partial [Trueperaceae bacterium]